MHDSARHLNQTPERPDTPITPPAAVVTGTVDIEGAQLANPMVAVSRLLASEAEAFARVDGDDRRLNVEVAVPDLDPCTVEQAGRWIRWAVHNAGVRGTITIEPPTACTGEHVPSRRSAGAEQVVDDDVMAVIDEVGWPGQDLGLSERESQVVALVAGGLTNAEIGERLYLGSETVKTYLRAALMKLGCRNRVQGAAFVARSSAFALVSEEDDALEHEPLRDRVDAVASQLDGEPPI